MSIVPFVYVIALCLLGAAAVARFSLMSAGVFFLALALALPSLAALGH